MNLDLVTTKLKTQHMKSKQSPTPNLSRNRYHPRPLRHPKTKAVQILLLTSQWTLKCCQNTYSNYVQPMDVNKWANGLTMPLPDIFHSGHKIRAKLPSDVLSTTDG